MRNEMTDDKTVYYRERSYKACVAEGWGLIFNHYKSVLKFAWAPVLMAAVGFAIVAFLLFVYYDWLTPAALAVTGALLLVYAVATACWHGAARVQVAFFRATGDLPTVSACNFMHNIRRQLLKSLACVVASAAALVAVGVVVWAAVAVSGWWWAALLPLLALVLTGSQLAQFWATEDGTLARAWRMFAREGWRNLGSWILVQLTGWSVAGLTTFVFLLPAAVLRKYRSKTVFDLIYDRTVRVSWKKEVRAELFQIFPGDAFEKVRAEIDAIHARVLRGRVFIALHMHAGDGNVHAASFGQADGGQPGERGVRLLCSGAPRRQEEDKAEGQQA